MYVVALYAVILRIIHVLYYVVQVIRNIFVRLAKFLFAGEDTNHLCSEIRKLKKKPNHLVFMLANEEPSFKDLANIVLWSVAAGIPIVSFYDHSGMLKHSKKNLYSVLNENNVKYSNGYKDPHQQKNGHKNGVSHPPIQINLFSMIDGRRAITEVAKQCARIRLKPSDIGVDFIDKELKKRNNEMPDPDLALYCGNCSTFGLLPWQIRLTEFINIETHHAISFSSFVLALQRYEKSEQRFGK